MLPENGFSPEPMAIAYATASVFLCILVYKAKSLLSYAWDAPGMNEPVGSGRIRQVDPDDGPARGAAVAAGNVMNSMTPGGGASLMVLVFFIFGAFVGAAALPAAFGIMGTVTTVNLLLLLVGGIAWALMLGRLTATLVSLAFSLVILGLVVGVLLFALNFVVTFARGGNDFFMDSAMNKFRETQTALNAYTRGDNSTWYGAYEYRVGFNVCSVFAGLKSYGNIDRVRSECDQGWVARQQQKAVQAQKNQLKKDKEDDLALKEHDATLEHLAVGMPINKVPPYWKSMTGSWSGMRQCKDGLTGVRLILVGDNKTASGVLQFFPHPLKRGRADQYGAFHVTATQDGNDVKTHAGTWIQQPKGQSSFDLNLALISAFIPGLVEGAASRDSCRKLDLRARVKVEK